MIGTNLSIETPYVSIPATFIDSVLTSIFPGDNPLAIAGLLVAWFLIGFVTMAIFFYFDKKRAMWKMDLIHKIIFSIILGFLSFMGALIAYMPFIFFNHDFLNFASGKLLPFMVIAGFVTYICLFLSSVRIKGREFLKKALYYEWVFIYSISFTSLVISVSIMIKRYWLIALWIAGLLLYFNFFTRTENLIHSTN